MGGTRWLDEHEQRTWRAFVRLHGELTVRLNRQLQVDSDLSLADYEVLVRLTDVPEGRLRIFELRRVMQWEQSRLSHQLSRMQQRGLVDRALCDDDRRGVFVVLTPAGRAAIEQAAPGHVEAVRRLVFDPLDPHQVAMLREIAETLVAHLDGEPG